VFPVCREGTADIGDVSDATGNDVWRGVFLDVQAVRRIKPIEIAMRRNFMGDKDIRRNLQEYSNNSKGYCSKRHFRIWPTSPTPIAGGFPALPIFKKRKWGGCNSI
jgi:hypothetical protein